MNMSDLNRHLDQLPLNLAPPEDEWGTLAVTAPPPPPLQPGDYPGVIGKIRIGNAADDMSLWMLVTYGVTGSDAEIVPEFATIAAKPGTPAAKRIGDGLRLLNRLSAATGIALPHDLKPSGIPTLFEGLPVTVSIGLKKRDGVPELVVRGLKKAAA